MNIIEQLAKELSPKLHKVTLKNGVVLYVRKPKLSEYESINVPKQTILLCVTDETGYTIFADGEEPGKVNLNEISMEFATEIYELCMALWKPEEDSNVEEIEKK